MHHSINQAERHPSITQLDQARASSAAQQAEVAVHARQAAEVPRFLLPGAADGSDGWGTDVLLQWWQLPRWVAYEKPMSNSNGWCCWLYSYWLVKN